MIVKSQGSFLMSIDFVKMHGLGNDFVIIDGRKNGFIPSKEFCIRLADRHRGVGYDQLIVLHKPKTAGTDLFMHIYNGDGSKAGACGNATRCVASLLLQETGKNEGVIETVTEPLKVWLEDQGQIKVAFGKPRLDWQDIPLAEARDTLNVVFDKQGALSACCVNVGNPHAVFFVPDVAAVPMEQVGPLLEHDPLFPERCNIEFAQILDASHIRMRVWERGTGITQACGSAALATLVAAVRRGLCDRKALVRMDGGDLMIEWREEDGHILMSGPASSSFRGTLSEELVSGTV
jgi:diaminopimelate epimerase